MSILRAPNITSWSDLTHNIQEVNRWADMVSSKLSTNLFDGLPVYASNAIAVAAGLSVGQFYRTSTGVVMIVY